MGALANSARMAVAKAARVIALFAAVAFACAMHTPALAQDDIPAEPMTVGATNEGTFGRLILTFPERLQMPDYSVGWENGVIVVNFETTAAVNLPDLTTELPGYIAAARMDPDNRGLRIGLNGDYQVNKTEAGESLYIDILPQGWSGPFPGLPSDIVEKLSERARRAAEIAEQKRRAAYVRRNRPSATVRVGRHPTFVRLIVDWSIEAEVNGAFSFDDGTGSMQFDWPVPVDLHDLQSDLPPEIASVSSDVTDGSSSVTFETAEGVEPRFYEESPQKFIVDFDKLEPESASVDLASLLPESAVPSARPAEDETEAGADAAESRITPPAAGQSMPQQPAHIRPYVDTIGSTVRVVFPFERDTAAAVFRRADTMWLVFDTGSSIGAPTDGDLDGIASDYSVSPSGGTSVVRMTLNSDRLATLGSEGRSWVLSLGDVPLSPAELMTFSRRQSEEGLFEVAADVSRPSSVHEIRDPEVGDVLEVVTVYPPARGVPRDLDHVDYSALRSVHGLVVKPWHDSVSVEIEGRQAIINAERGLILSSPRMGRGTGSEKTAPERDGFVDLAAMVEREPAAIRRREHELVDRLAAAERPHVNARRMKLAEFYLANEFSYEALGVLEVLAEDVDEGARERRMRIARAAASVAADRYQDALEILNTDTMAARPDALMWRAIARAGTRDFDGARADALVAEPVIDDYPSWVRERFLMAGVDAALKTNDLALATRYIGLIDTAALDRLELSRYELLTARVDEAAGRFDDALETLGHVVAADLRPTRAEAVYRTLTLLDRMGRLDTQRGANTLATQAVAWRGGDLEARMLRLLADLQFRNKSYREGFRTVQTLAEAHPDSREASEVAEKARMQFADLYLNGEADAMPPVEALSLYYDFQNLTPAGARGDEMVRNLARRLVEVDLLDQAANLLQYQVDNRLDGAARAQIAADLAVIYLAGRKPAEALDALRATMVAGMPPALERQRRILGARALIDSNRLELALDVLKRMDGHDADLLRVQAQWQSKRYQQAAETLERLHLAEYGEKDLAQSARRDILKAAVGFVLANDSIGSSRLRERFGQAMSETPQWPLFDFLTTKVQADSLEFRKAAEEVADGDTLSAFLSAYSRTYGAEGALTPDKAAPAADA